MVPADEEQGQPVCPEDQVRHQTWEDPARLSIQIGCPPFAPRPPEVFAATIEDAGLSPEDLEDQGSTIFGCREYLMRADAGSMSRYLNAKRTIGERLNMMNEPHSCINNMAKYI